MQVQKKKSKAAAARSVNSVVKTVPMKPVRLRHSTVKKLGKILEVVNKKDFGKKVRPDAVIDLALSLVSAKEIELLRDTSMTNADRLEAAFRSYTSRESGLSRDEFIGLLLAGKVGAPLGSLVAPSVVEFAGPTPQI